MENWGLVTYREVRCSNTTWAWLWRLDCFLETSSSQQGYPSWELTYPLPTTRSWVDDFPFFFPGGICDRSMEGSFTAWWGEPTSQQFWPFPWRHFCWKIPLEVWPAFQLATYVEAQKKNYGSILRSWFLFDLYYQDIFLHDLSSSFF